MFRVLLFPFFLIGGVLGAAFRLAWGAVKLALGLGFIALVVNAAQGFFRGLRRA